MTRWSRIYGRDLRQLYTVLPSSCVNWRNSSKIGRPTEFASVRLGSAARLVLATVAIAVLGGCRHKSAPVAVAAPPSLAPPPAAPGPASAAPPSGAIPDSETDAEFVQSHP